MPGNIYTLTASDFASWPEPNYDDPPTRSWLPAFTISWQVVSTVFMVARFYLRATGQAGTFGPDDVLITLGWCCALGLAITATVLTQSFHMGRHIWDIPPDLWPFIARGAWIAQLCFLFCTCFTKLSLLFFYRRMLQDTFRGLWTTLVWKFIIGTVAAYIGYFVAYCTICIPLDAYWLAYAFPNPLPPDRYTSLNGDALTISCSILIAATDVWAVAIPCLMLRRFSFDVKWTQRLALNCVFCLSFLATGVGIARAYFLWQLNHSSDVSTQGFNLIAAASLECQLGIICASAPALRAWFRHYFGDIKWRLSLSDIKTSRHRSRDVESPDVAMHAVPGVRLDSRARSVHGPDVVDFVDEVALEAEFRKGDAVHRTKEIGEFA